VQFWVELHEKFAVPHHLTQTPLLSVSMVCIQSVAWAKPTLVEATNVKLNKAEVSQCCNFVFIFIFSPFGD